MTATASIDVRSNRNRLKAKLRNEDGVGLIELLIALLVLNVGIFATLGAFASAATTIRTASHISTAAALSDKQTLPSLHSASRFVPDFISSTTHPLDTTPLNEPGGASAKPDS